MVDQLLIRIEIRIAPDQSFRYNTEITTQCRSGVPHTGVEVGDDEQQGEQLGHPQRVDTHGHAQRAARPAKRRTFSGLHGGRMVALKTSSSLAPQPLRSRTGLHYKKTDGLNFGLELS